MRLSRRDFCRSVARLGTCAAGVALVSAACGQLPSLAPAKVPRIGYLAPGTRESRSTRIAPFLDGLADLGYVEGRTISIEWRFSPQGQDAQFADLAAQLARIPVDLIVADGSTPAALAARKATSTVPIYAAVVAWPVQTGLVSSLARPGSNLTASTSSAPGLSGKRIELAREIVPGLMRAAGLVDATNAAYDVVGWDELRAAADEAGLPVERIDLRSANDLDAAFERAVSLRAEAVFDVQNPLLLPVRDRYAALALQHRLPCVSAQREYVEVGHLMSYGPNYPALYSEAAAYVDKILKGARPADLPVQQPIIWDLTVNTTTLQALGLTIPPSVLPLVTEWIS